jgi:hypothetical protein
MDRRPARATTAPQSSAARPSASAPARLRGREIAERLARRDSRIDRRLVNSVLTHEGGAFVAHNPANGKCTVRPR